MKKVGAPGSKLHKRMAGLGGPGGAGMPPGMPGMPPGFPPEGL